MTSVLKNYLENVNSAIEDVSSFLQIVKVSKKIVGPSFDISLSDGEVSVMATFQPSDFCFGSVPKRLAVVRIHSSSGHAATGDLLIVIKLFWIFRRCNMVSKFGNYFLVFIFDALKRFLFPPPINLDGQIFSHKENLDCARPPPTHF